MDGFFAADYSGHPFELFDTSHLVALFVLIALNISLIKLKKTDANLKTTIRWVLALMLYFNEFAWHIWNFAVGRWTLQTMLPLQLCSVLVWISGLMLVTRNYRMYEFCYLLGIGGAVQALLTPDLGIYGFPHFRFFQTFISHGLIITSAIYMTTVENFRPTWWSLGRVAFWVNIYAIAMFFFNSAMGSNYLMLNHKPDTPSLLDLMPEWPIYILYMEIIGVFSILILYLPFAIRDGSSQRTSPGKAPSI